MNAELLEMMKSPGFNFVLGAVIGFFISRFTRSKAERDTYQTTLSDRGERLTREKDKKYNEFIKAIEKYAERDREGSVSLDDFRDVATAGDLYFSELRNIANACLEDQVSNQVRNDTFIPALKEAVDTSIPSYYSALEAISQKIDSKFDGKLRRNNYESIYAAVEKFST